MTPGEPQWKVGDVHPEMGTVCVAIGPEGQPRWDYPRGHPYHGVLENLLEQQAAEQRPSGGRKRRA